VHVQQSSFCVKKHPTSATLFHGICGRQSAHTDLGLHAGAYKKPVRDTALLKQQLVEVRVDFEQTIVNHRCKKRSNENKKR